MLMRTTNWGLYFRIPGPPTVTSMFAARAIVGKKIHAIKAATVVVGVNFWMGFMMDYARIVGGENRKD